MKEQKGRAPVFRIQSISVRPNNEMGIVATEPADHLVKTDADVRATEDQPENLFAEFTMLQLLGMKVSD